MANQVLFSQQMKTIEVGERYFQNEQMFVNNNTKQNSTEINKLLQKVHSQCHTEYGNDNKFWQNVLFFSVVQFGALSWNFQV